MKAVTWHGPGDVRVTSVPDPVLQEPTDAIVRVTSTAICGSDLHLYGPLAPFMTKGDVLGHEFLGIVEEVGPDVPGLVPGDRVVVPFNISCGSCWMCSRGLFAQCETTQVREYGRGAMLFGYTTLYGGVPGGQAELVRVPHAGFGPVKLPADLPDERFLYLSDILPTAWQAVQYANIAAGDSIAVLGLGPVGQLAVRVAQRVGAGEVIGVDLVPERLALAASGGATVVDARESRPVTEALRTLTGGRGPDAVIDAVGMEAHGNPVTALALAGLARLPRAVSQPLAEKMAVDRLSALETAVEAVRRGGTVSVSGVYGGMLDPMALGMIFDKGLELRTGQCHVRRWTDELLALLTAEDAFGVDSLATHHLPLDEAPEAYEMFRSKDDGCLKVVLHP